MIDMEKVISDGKVKYQYTEEEKIRRRGYEFLNPKKEIDYEHITSKATQEAIKQIEFCKKQITSLQNQINLYNEIRKQNQLIAY